MNEFVNPSAPAEAPIRAELHWRHGLLAIAVFVGDQLTKGVIQRWPQEQVRDVVPGLIRIIHVENPGVAFGLFQDASPAWRASLIAASSLALLLVLGTLWRSQRTVRTGYAMALILGGACGNLLDRIVHGRVVDFLLVYHGGWSWPAFNIADSAIVCGAILLVWEILAERVAPYQTGSAAPTEVPAAPGGEDGL